MLRKKTNIVVTLLLCFSLNAKASDTPWLWPEDYDQMLDYAGLFNNSIYSFGGRKPNSEDCSSLVQKIFSKLGIDLPRSSREQARDERFVEVSIEDIRKGDLVFFRNTWRRGVSHVAIMLDSEIMLHTSPASRKVDQAKLNASHPLWRKIHSIKRWKKSVDYEYVRPRFSWDEKV